MTEQIPLPLRRLLRADGRALVVAMDHGLSQGPARGLEDPARVIDTVLEAGADAIMTSYGVVKKYGAQIAGRAPIILRIDGGPSIRTGTWREYSDWRLLYQVEEAARIGADAVVVMHFLGSEVELDTLEIVADVAVQCAQTGIPLLVEALPCPHPNIPDIFDPEMIALAARIAAEHGADCVKTTYSGDVESFRSVVERSTVPLLVLGGERMDSLQAVLDLTHGAITAGAAGIAMGRNIWQSPDPAAVVRALAAIIHAGATAAEAGEQLVRQ